jgi:hypothetical protein
MPVDIRYSDIPHELWRSIRNGNQISWAPEPTELVTGFGFNIWNSWNMYTNGANESATQMLTRLSKDYGSYGWTKSFYGSSFVPSKWGNLTQGENNPLNPADHHIICMGWSLGTVANGSKDTTLTSFANSVPEGKHVILCMNEVDAPGRIANWTTYKNDMDHMYDLLTSLTLKAKVEVWDCFMQFALDPASGPRFQNSWVNPAKRHGIVWDCYWNQYTIDASGNTYVGSIETKMNELGMTRWCLGEFGDRRPGSTGSNPAPDDSSRAVRLQTHINRLLSAEPQPEGLLWFNAIGTTGDHRILTPPVGDTDPYGNDTATHAVLAQYIEEARANS